ncbi:MAG: HPr kinase/phosphorylase [Gammaproteobacteria bacterium]|nr:HPr kinase/phosphorylase [Gammaproteobacteria bacterium]
MSTFSRPIIENILSLPGLDADAIKQSANLILDATHPRLCGRFDLCFMPQIAVLDLAAEQMITRLSQRSADEVLANAYDDGCRAILATADNSLGFYEQLKSSCQKYGIWSGRSSAIPPHVQDQLRDAQVKQTVIHGVMMDVFGVGVLVTGESGLGKSELALELLSRGHVLVADDAPLISRTTRNTLEAICPPVLQDFLEIRGLGLLNIAKMYGQTKIRHQKRLDLNLHLVKATKSVLANIDRIITQQDKLETLGLSVPKLAIPVAPGRNLSVIVEAAVRNFRLQRSGYDPIEDIGQRQLQSQGQGLQ